MVNIIALMPKILVEKTSQVNPNKKPANWANIEPFERPVYTIKINIKLGKIPKRFKYLLKENWSKQKAR
jgi:hypothetical protein